MDNPANVKCCDDGDKRIFFDYSNYCFYLLVFDPVRQYWHPERYSIGPINRCPWCGILLDTNLLEE